MDRREFLEQFVITSVLCVVVGAGALGLVVRLVTSPRSSPTLITSQTSTTQTDQNRNSSQSTTSQTQLGNTNTVPNGYVFVTQLSALAGKSQAYFNHPKYGSSILFNYNGNWSAFSAVCTHAGCSVNFDGSSIFCPCHNGYFSPLNGAVTGGPPPSPLPEYSVRIINNNLYVSDSAVN